MKTLISFLLLISFLSISSCTGSKTESSDGADNSSSSQAAPIKEVKSEVPVVDDPVVPTVEEPTEASSPVTAYKFSEGNGTLASPYAIKTVEDLKHVKDKLGAQYALINDLDLTGISLEPIGDMTKPFSGVFYGRNKSINNFKLSVTDGTTVALFGVVSGTISQLVARVDISSNGYAAGLVGTLINNGFITGCTVYGKITSSLGGNGFNTGIGNPILVSAAQNASVYGSAFFANFNGQTPQHYVHFGPISTTSQTCSGGTCVPAEYVCNSDYVIRASQCCHVKGGTNKCY